MNIGTISTAKCVDVPPGIDTRCDDPAFALANPDLCPTEQAFILKPGVAIICELGSIKFKAFTVLNGIEMDVTSQTVFTSSNSAVALVGATTGDATGVTAGEVTVSGSYIGFKAQAELTVLTGQNCCDDVTVALMVMVDNTKSMTQEFGGGYSNKLAFAKAAAIALIDSVNESKDLVGLMRFTKETQVVLSVPSSDKESVSALVPNIAQTQDKTEFFDALGTAIAALDLTTADRKVLVIISDGEDTQDSYLTDNPLVVADDFKAAGGIIICVGIRAHAAGYSLLSALATGGFFINAYEATSQTTFDYLIGLKGYICGGSCGVDGDETDNRGTLNYQSLINWDLIDAETITGELADSIFPDNPAQSGFVDLLGNGFFDVLPGNGLYLDLTSGTGLLGPEVPILVTKDKFAVTNGDQYRISIKISRNQLPYAFGQPAALVMILGATSGLVYAVDAVVGEYQFGVISMAWTFPAATSEDVRIVIWQKNATIPISSTSETKGLLLMEVRFDDLTTSTQIFFDNFDDENPTYVGPKCGQGTEYVEIGMDYVSGEFVPAFGYMVGYDCYGEGCLDTPPPSQSADPNPLPNLELGTSGGTFSSTQTGCAPACPVGYVNIGQPVVAQTLSSGVEYETRIQMSVATAIKRWRVTFLRVWDESGEDPIDPLTLWGSDDGVDWELLQTQEQITGGAAGLKLVYTLTIESDAFLFYRAMLGTGNPTGSGKVFSLSVFETPDNPICKTANAQGGTAAQAMSNALLAAIDAAKAEQDCRKVYTATEVFSDGIVTGSATASSLNSQEEAQIIAARLAEENAT